MTGLHHYCVCIPLSCLFRTAIRETKEKRDAIIARLCGAGAQRLVCTEEVTGPRSLVVSSAGDVRQASLQSWSLSSVTHSILLHGQAEH